MPDKALCPLIEKWPHETSHLETHLALGQFIEIRVCDKNCHRCQLESWLQASGLAKLIEAGQAYREWSPYLEANEKYDAALRQFEEASR